LDYNYFKTDQINILENNSASITEFYSKGYVFTRVKKGLMNQTRSLRIDLSKFELTSENKRILNKNQDLSIKLVELPYPNYDWNIHKLGKDFYTIKFGDNIMSASKIKEMFLEVEKSNVNNVFEYSLNNLTCGYCLVYLNKEILHYAFPFYDLNISKEQNIGMAQMLKAIIWAKENNLHYIYLGSVVDNLSKYKLQFKALEWFNTDSKVWESDLIKLKELLVD
jgi:arginyl-tRNA--protein-N-Asp/Glu arginylyltransferase